MAHSDLAGELLSLCWPDFTLYQGCVLRIGANDARPSIDNYYDLTDAEASVNHVHLNDIFWCGTGYTNLLTKEQCFRIAEMWMAKLRLQFPRRRFVVYLFINGVDSHLRFHTFRPAEPLWTDWNLRFDQPHESIAMWFI